MFLGLLLVSGTRLFLVYTNTLIHEALKYEMFRHYFYFLSCGDIVASRAITSASIESLWSGPKLGFWYVIGRQNRRYRIQRSL